MSTYTGLNLAIPSPPTRQVGVGVLGSPISLSRGTSDTSVLSEVHNPEQSLRENLIAFQTYLQHEIDFVNNEINALIQMPITSNAAQDAAFLRLRNSLKIRYNHLQKKMNRLQALLEVL